MIIILSVENGGQFECRKLRQVIKFKTLILLGFRFLPQTSPKLNPTDATSIHSDPRLSRYTIRPAAGEQQGIGAAYAGKSGKGLK